MGERPTFPPSPRRAGRGVVCVEGSDGLSAPRRQRRRILLAFNAHGMQGEGAVPGGGGPWQPRVQPREGHRPGDSDR